MLEVLIAYAISTGERLFVIYICAIALAPPRERDAYMKQYEG